MALIGEEIERNGLSDDLAPLLLVFTGKGNVSQVRGLASLASLPMRTYRMLCSGCTRVGFRAADQVYRTSPD